MKHVPVGGVQRVAEGGRVRQERVRPPQLGVGLVAVGFVFGVGEGERGEIVIWNKVTIPDPFF